MAAVVLSKPVVIAGITLEATELSYALQALAMTQAELEQVMAPSSAWPFQASLDGKGAAGARPGLLLPTSVNYHQE